MSAVQPTTKDDDWQVIDAAEEMEAVVLGFQSGELGMSLVQDQPPKPRDHAARQGTSHDTHDEASANLQLKSDAEVELQADVLRLQQQLAAVVQENQSLRAEVSRGGTSCMFTVSLSFVNTVVVNGCA